MPREPRDYQLAAINAVRDAFLARKKGVVIEVFTGAGKGLIIAAIAKMTLAKGGRVLVAVNRDNLVQQLHDSLVEQGLYPKLERGMDHASPMTDCVVGSIQTMQGDRLLKWAPDHFRLVICDEIHFGAADTFKATLSHFGNAYHLGLSATIERHDGAGLWHGYEDCVFSMPLQKGIEQGWLVPFSFEELPVPITLSDKQANKKMWTEKDEEQLFSTNNYLPRLFSEAAARVHGAKALFFWPNCDSSKEADAHFKTEGLESRHVDGYLPKTQIADTLEWFKSPGPKCLHNADLLSYGYDNPSIDTVGIMRISRSIPMLKQRLGRGTRPACVVDGLTSPSARREAIANSVKPVCRVLDLMLQMDDVKNTFADATALITSDPDEREFLRQEARKNGTPMTMEDIEGKLKAKRETDKEKQLAKLAEDAANSAERWKNKVSDDGYIKHVVSTMFNPAHKPAEKWMYGKLRAMGANIPRDTVLSGFQFFKIKERLEKLQTK